MKRIIANRMSWLAVLLALAACGQDNNSNSASSAQPAPSATGTWLMSDQLLGNGTHKYSVMKIAADSVTVTDIESKDGHSVTCSVTSMAQVTPNTIKTLEAKVDSKTIDIGGGGHLSCLVDTVLITFGYSVTPEQLTLSTEGAQGASTLQRVH